MFLYIDCCFDAAYQMEAHLERRNRFKLKISIEPLVEYASISSHTVVVTDAVVVRYAIIVFFTIQ